MEKVTKEQLEEHMMAYEDGNFEAVDPATLNHRERKNRLKDFRKMFKEHEKRKPSYNIEEPNDMKRYAAQMRVQVWATRYGILKRKIDELGQNYKR